jgi:hypothetical protein
MKLSALLMMALAGGMVGFATSPLFSVNWCLGLGAIGLAYWAGLVPG